MHRGGDPEIPGQDSVAIPQKRRDPRVEQAFEKGAGAEGSAEKQQEEQIS